jgi:hypothetical protein
VRVPGVAGGALRFDGSSFVRLPDAPELAPASFSVEAVVRADASPGRWSYLVSRGGRECFAGAYGLYTGTTGGAALYVFDGSRYVVSAAARAEDLWDGAWHHVAGTFDGERLRLYVDGRPVGQPSSAVLRIDYASTSSSTAFGRYVGSCDLSYRGDLDLVRLWSGARSGEVLADAAMRALHLPGAGPLPGLPAAAPPTVVDALPPAGPAVTAPGAPARACAVAVSRRKIVAGRRAAVRVRVTLRGQPVRSVRVVARRADGRRTLSSARTGAGGRVRLVLHVRTPGRVRVTASMLPGCVPRIIRVARKR